MDPETSQQSVNEGAGRGLAADFDAGPDRDRRGRRHRVPIAQDVWAEPTLRGRGGYPVPTTLPKHNYLPNPTA